MKKCVALAGVILLFLFLRSQSALSASSEDAEVNQVPIVVAELDQGPGNLTVTPDGEIIVSLHQFYGHDTRVAVLGDDGQLLPFAEAANINSALGLQADTAGRLWLLDNAMRGGERPRLIAWELAGDRVVADIELSSVALADSFLNDLAVDAEQGVVYIADPAGGANAAIIVVNLEDGSARRLLQGHSSVVPEDMDLVIDGTPVRIKLDDGSEIRPRIGVNPIAIDSTGEWLYYGPMHGTAMYRIPTDALRDVSLSAEELASRVERFADKPISDGISIDDAGNIYLGDLGANAIGVISAEGVYQTWISDPQFSWIDAFSFGPDGYLYTVANQLHLSAVLNGGVAATEPPFLIIKLKPLADGTTGR
ncbi:MAG: L-dopachrome tautomerase-related protein [Pseudomonadota bacterium]